MQTRTKNKHDVEPYVIQKNNNLHRKKEHQSNQNFIYKQTMMKREEKAAT